jgi:hypothetical protein
MRPLVVDDDEPELIPMSVVEDDADADGPIVDEDDDPLLLPPIN